RLAPRLNRKMIPAEVVMPAKRADFGGRTEARVLQASRFRSDVTAFRLNARPRPKNGSAFRGIRRNACTQSRRLTAWRSQVQILPPLLRKAPETAPFASSAELCSCPSEPLLLAGDPGVACRGSGG